MGAIGGLIGTAGGVSGTGISGPQGANVQNAVTPEMVQKAYATGQGGIEAQKALLDALQKQNGLGAQTNVMGQMQNLESAMGRAGGIQNQSAAMNLQQALNQQLAANQGAANVGAVFNQGQALASQLAGAGAVANQTQALEAQRQLAQQQQGTAQMYRDIAQGVGPNPAQAALNNATGQNVANQAALMAGQRGASANVGLLARQAAMQGANTQQQAVGQSAQMQAQQQLNALQGLGAQQAAIGNTQQSVAGIAGQQLAAQQALQSAMAGQAAQQVGLQQSGITAQAQQAQSQVAQQQAQQAALAAQANQQAQQQIAGTGAYTQATQGQQGQMLGAMGAQNQANVSSQGNINTANAALATKTMEGQQGMIGGLMQGAGQAAAMMADGGAVDVEQPKPPSPSSSFGQFLSSWGQGMNNQTEDQNAMSAMGAQSAGGRSMNKGATALASALSKFKPSSAPQGGTGTSATAPVAMAPVGMLSNGGLADHGGHVAANTFSQKAVKRGNSYANDKIPAMLSEGEIVIPRTVTQSSDPVRGAADFVAKVMAKRGKK